MKIELKNIDYSKTLSEAAHAFTAKVYIDGLYVANAQNRGRDLLTDVSPRDKDGWALLDKAELYCKAIQGVPDPEKDIARGAHVYLGHYVDQLVTVFLDKKEDKRMEDYVSKKMKRGLVFGNIKKEIHTIDFGMDMSEVLSIAKGHEVLKGKLQRQVIPELKGEQKLLNTNIPEHLLLEAGLKPGQYVLPRPAVQPKLRPKPGRTKRL